MAKSNTERSREHRERQAQMIADLRSKGLAQVLAATAAPAAAPIERFCQLTADFFLKKPAQVGDVDFDATHQSLVHSFLSSGAGQIASFEIPEVGTIAVKLIPWRSTPVLCTCAISGWNVPKDIFLELFPKFRRASELVGYHWRTSAYVDVCLDLGFNPTHGEPTFHSEYDDLAWALLQWDADIGIHAVLKAGGPACEARNFVFDVLDLLRIDDERGNVIAPPHLEAAFARYRDDLAAAGVPCLDEIETLLAHPAPLGLKGNTGGVAGTIEFLPSFANFGYSESFYGWTGRHGSDGWIEERYQDVFGVAIEPSPLDRARTPWLKTVVQHLAHRVVFLPADRVEQYMAGEGAYWAWRHGQVAATRSQAFLWSLRKPAMPINALAEDLYRAAQLVA